MTAASQRRGRREETERELRGGRTNNKDSSMPQAVADVSCDGVHSGEVGEREKGKVSCAPSICRSCASVPIL